MENASKALLITAAVLIAILIASLAVYLFTSMAENSASMYRRLEASEITEFNQNFLNYDDRTDLTIQDVATIVNLAVDSNKNQRFSTIITVNVTGCSCGGSINWTDRYKDSLADNILKEHILDIQNDKKFACEVKINPDTTVVGTVTITGI